MKSSSVKKPCKDWYHPTPFHLSLARLFPLILAFLAFFPSGITHQAPAFHFEEQEITLLFAGDVMQHMPQVEASCNEATGTYRYDTCFAFVKPEIAAADIAVVNLETTLGGSPYSGYPAFSSPDELARALKNAGFNLIGTANNHCCDRGKTGIERTIQILDREGLQRFGTYLDSADYQLNNPLIIRKKGFKLAFLNYTYGTNGIAVPQDNIVNIIEKERIAGDLAMARDSVPDKIIVFIHWGTEYQREPNDFQKDIATFCFQNGADIIIGSHPHVIQPMEWIKAENGTGEKLVVWSLGNYVSNQRQRYTDGGSMCRIKLKKQFNRASISEAGYSLTWVYNPVADGKRQYYILPVNRFEKDSAFMDATSFQQMKAFAADSREHLVRNINIGEWK